MVLFLGSSIALIATPGLDTMCVPTRGVEHVDALYLVYLGVQMFRSDDGLQLETGGENGDGENGFQWDTAVNVLNPKVALFFLAFLPQFAETGSNSDFRMTLLGLTYTELTLAYLSAVAFRSTTWEASSSASKFGWRYPSTSGENQSFRNTRQ